MSPRRTAIDKMSLHLHSRRIRQTLRVINSMSTITIGLPKRKHLAIVLSAGAWSILACPIYYGSRPSSHLASRSDHRIRWHSRVIMPWMAVGQVVGVRNHGSIRFGQETPGKGAVVLFHDAHWKGKGELLRETLQKLKASGYTLGKL